MSRIPSNTQATAQLARKLAIDELLRRGATSVAERKRGGRHVLEVRVPSGETFTIIVKARTSGTWQVSAADGDRNKIIHNWIWLFVDIEDPGQPIFHVAPDAWVRVDIAEHHARYLKKYGGRRAVSPQSDHHAVQYTRIAAWKNRWELLDLR